MGTVRTIIPTMERISMLAFSADSFAIDVAIPGNCYPPPEGESKPVLEFIQFVGKIGHFYLPLRISRSLMRANRQGEHAPMSVLLREPQSGHMGQ